MRTILFLLAAVTMAGCPDDGDEPGPDAAVAEPDAELRACDTCGGGVCDPDRGWVCGPGAPAPIACYRPDACP